MIYLILYWLIGMVYMPLSIRKEASVRLWDIIFVLLILWTIWPLIVLDQIHLSNKFNPVILKRKP